MIGFLGSDEHPLKGELICTIQNRSKNVVGFYRCYCLLRFIIFSFMQGKIKNLTDKNFGFITAEGQDKELFFHANELVGVSFNDLQAGDTVTFEVSDTPKGPAAVKVSKV